MNDNDRSLVEDMLEHAQKAQKFVAGKSRDDLDNDDLLAFGLARALEIIGEAAQHISEKTQHEHPEIEWRPIIGMRHRLAHDYLHVDLDVVWDVVNLKLPKLTTQLEAILSEK